MGCSESKVVNKSSEPVKKIIPDKNGQSQLTQETLWPEQPPISTRAINQQSDLQYTNSNSASGIWGINGNGTKDSTVKMNPAEDQDAYYAQMRKQIEDQKKKRERDGVKRQIAERQLQKLAKEHPDLLQEKAQEMIMKYDTKTMNKSTKVLPPLMTANTLTGSQNMMKSFKNPLLMNQSGQFEIPENIDQQTPQAFNLSINIGVNIQNNDSKIVTSKIDRQVDLDDLLDELDNEVNIASPTFDYQKSSSALGKQHSKNLSPNPKLLKSGQNSRKDLRTGSIQTQGEDTKTELWSHQNSGSILVSSSNKQGKSSYRDSLVPHHEHKRSKFEADHILEEDNNSFNNSMTRGGGEIKQDMVQINQFDISTTHNQSNSKYNRNNLQNIVAQLNDSVDELLNL
ncbi:UNKNOWN [Stylonychia lemnae]|uniref:Uncharacterized protein n=1 Tax=Stylonychia lemnae TaxID=5949 RepID=A0A078A0K9_STYLE|nr:UNKNOWN [Stylonychia lemnae]|eukprot:CDW75392.1 UNKNOWN [Stylonychia lemnae]